MLHAGGKHLELSMHTMHRWYRQSAFMQNHHIKLLSEEASTSLRAAGNASHTLGSSDHAATYVKADPAEKASEDEKKTAVPDSLKSGMFTGSNAVKRSAASKLHSIQEGCDALQPSCEPFRSSKWGVLSKQIWGKLRSHAHKLEAEDAYPGCS